MTTKTPALLAALAAAPQEGETVTTATWGGRYTWPDGLAIEVSRPVPCTPGQYAVPTGIKQAVKVTIKVVNGSKETVNATLLTVGNNAQHGGKAAEAVFDSSGGCGSGGEMGDVLPGKVFETAQSYSVGAEPGDLQITFQPTFSSAKAIYVGQA